MKYKKTLAIQLAFIPFMFGLLQELGHDGETWLWVAISWAIVTFISLLITLITEA